MPAHIDEFLGQRLDALSPDSVIRISVLLEVKPSWKLPKALQNDVEITSTTVNILSCNMTPAAIRFLEQDPLVISIA